MTVFEKVFENRLWIAPLGACLLCGGCKPSDDSSLAPLEKPTVRIRPQNLRHDAPIKVPPRDTQAKPNLIDLTPYYNVTLTESWHSLATGLDNSLSALPRGLQNLGGIDFDVRGVIQIAGAQLRGGRFPSQVKGIKIGRKCQRLHVLHGTGWQVQDLTRIGSYVLHYSDGSDAELNIIYGTDVRDWWFWPQEPKESKEAVAAWTGKNPATEQQGMSLRLYRSTRENPNPDLIVESIDFISSMSGSAPFLIAITVE